jgi:hypothetical protein
VSRRSLAQCAIPAAVLAALALAGPAAAQAPGTVASFHAGFTTARPGASSGYSLRVSAAPPAAGTAVPPFLRQTVSFPAGTRFDTRGARRCTASDAEIREQGARAVCPAASRIGTGAAEGVLGGQPVHFDLVAYDLPGRIHFAAERDGQPLRQGFTGTYAGRTLTIDVGTAGGSIAPTLFEARIAAHARRGRRLVTTPERCPSSRRWRVVSTFTAIDAPGRNAVGPVQRATATIACRG